MKVFKFGGASLKTADGIRNVASIIQSEQANNLLVIVSAMGKTTDLLERVMNLSTSNKEFEQTLSSLRNYHYEVIGQLFADGKAVTKEINAIFSDLENQLAKEEDFDQVYDQVVSLGEVLSSVIVHHFLLSQNVHSYWIDARTFIQTDSTFREGKVDWSATANNIQPLKSILSDNIII